MTLRTLIPVAGAMALGVAFALLPAAAQETAAPAKADAAKHRVLVELFTSQG